MKIRTKLMSYQLGMEKGVAASECACFVGLLFNLQKKVDVTV